MKRKKKQYSKKLKRAKGQNKHHLTPRSRGGLSKPSNLLRLDIEKHDCWHKIFGNRTLDEVIRVLQRLKEVKHEM